MVISWVRKPLNEICMPLPKDVSKKFVTTMVSLQDFSDVSLRIQNLGYDLQRNKGLQIIKYVLKGINK